MGCYAECRCTCESADTKRDKRKKEGKEDNP
jgi:hypothetical protein